MFPQVLGYGTLAGAATIAGTLLILNRYDWAKHNSIHLMSFAAGVMLALAFMHLIPEAIHLAEGNEVHVEEAEHEEEAPQEAEHGGEDRLTFIIILLGLASFHLLENIVSIHPRHDVEMHVLPDTGHRVTSAAKEMTVEFFREVFGNR